MADGNLDSNYEFSNQSLLGLDKSFPIEGAHGVHPSGVPSGTSSIEDSESVLVLLIPPPNSPILPTPSDGGDFNGVVALISNNKVNGAEFLLYTDNLQNQVVNEMLEKWNKSIKEEQEKIRELISSPQYQQMEEIRIKGDPKQGVVSGVMTNQAANSLDANPLIFILDKAQKSDALAPSDKDQGGDAIVPLAAAAIIGGALAIGIIDVNAVTNTPVNGAVDLVSRLQPIMPQVIQDLPSINLMVMPLVYFTSWDSSVGNMANKGHQSDMSAVIYFAKSMISLITNPEFIKNHVVAPMESSDPLSQTRKEYREAVLKLILACVALSLLYSVEVGKSVSGKFWGMEPQEFKGMLNGEIPIPKPTANSTDAQRAQYTLLNIIKTQLDNLPPEEKAKVLNAIFEYLSNPQQVKDMLDPKKVFSDVLSSSAFDQNASSLDTKPA